MARFTRHRLQHCLDWVTNILAPHPNDEVGAWHGYLLGNWAGKQPLSATAPGHGCDGVYKSGAKRDGLDVQIAVVFRLQRWWEPECGGKPTRGGGVSRNVSVVVTLCPYHATECDKKGDGRCSAVAPDLPMQLSRPSCVSSWEHSVFVTWLLETIS